jgi:microtubule-associated protein-like 1/2
MIAKESRNVGAKMRAVSYNHDGSTIAVVTYDGRLIVFEENLAGIVASVTIAATWSQTLRFSPDGSTVAIGCHDSTMYLLDTKSFSCRAKCLGHSAFLTAIDFSEDSSTIRTCSGDYELLFWNSQTGKQIPSATVVRDVDWETTSSPFGWAVQGVWAPDSDGISVNSVDLSPDGRCIVSGDDDRKVKLFKYPAPKENSEFREYCGHSEHIVNVRFTSDGKYVLSVGGLDKAVLQYEVKASGPAQTFSEN